MAVQDISASISLKYFSAYLCLEMQVPSCSVSIKCGGRRLRHSSSLLYAISLSLISNRRVSASCSVQVSADGRRREHNRQRPPPAFFTHVRLCAAPGEGKQDDDEESLGDEEDDSEEEMEEGDKNEESMSDDAADPPDSAGDDGATSLLELDITEHRLNGKESGDEAVDAEEAVLNDKYVLYPMLAGGVDG